MWSLYLVRPIIVIGVEIWLQYLKLERIWIRIFFNLTQRHVKLNRTQHARLLIISCDSRTALAACNSGLTTSCCWCVLWKKNFIFKIRLQSHEQCHSSVWSLSCRLVEIKELEEQDGRHQCSCLSCIFVERRRGGNNMVYLVLQSE